MDATVYTYVFEDVSIMALFLDVNKISCLESISFQHFEDNFGSYC